MNEYLTPREAADVVGVSKCRVYQMIERGQMQAEKTPDSRFPTGYALWVSRAEAERVRDTPRPVGRPPKKNLPRPLDKLSAGA